MYTINLLCIFLNRFHCNKSSFPSRCFCDSIYKCDYLCQNKSAKTTQHQWKWIKGWQIRDNARIALLSSFNSAFNWWSSVYFSSYHNFGWSSQGRKTPQTKNFINRWDWRIWRGRNHQDTTFLILLYQFIQFFL